MENKTCYNCKYANHQELECRCNPPVYLDGYKDVFPRISLDSWCGKHEPKKENIKVGRRGSLIP